MVQPPAVLLRKCCAAHRTHIHMPHRGKATKCPETFPAAGGRASQMLTARGMGGAAASATSVAAAAAASAACYCRRCAAVATAMPKGPSCTVVTTVYSTTAVSEDVRWYVLPGGEGRLCCTGTAPLLAHLQAARGYPYLLLFRQCVSGCASSTLAARTKLAW